MKTTIAIVSFSLAAFFAAPVGAKCSPIRNAAPSATAACATYP